MQRQALGALTLALAALLVMAGPVAAKVRSKSGLHNARYCEILELKGLPPGATAVVWNSLGLNACPADWWASFDAAALAQERGDTAVVLNGPRYFLMDSVTAATGRVASFHGLPMRKVATIPIRTAADLVQTPYTERTIARNNTWSWKAGRTVYELVAPDGTTYVMQSYAQIRDPALTIGDLAGLGSRLTPPAGWTYRTRRLTRPLDLVAKGSATIIQDDLLDTYQRA
jgi:hypothetical protein